MHIKKLFRFIGSSQLFWRLRHLFQPNWILNYEKKDSTYILDIVRKYQRNTILDFGCASGKTLEDIKDLSPSNFYVCGVDINVSAINFCNMKFSQKYSSGYMFSLNFDCNKFEEFLLSHEKDKFDLIIFDRVLYSINDDDILLILEKACSITDMIFIDDFDCENQLESHEYKHRDWSNILNKFNFSIILKTDTCYKKVEKASAKSMIFKQNQ